MVKQFLIVAFAILVIAVTAFNVSTMLDSNRAYDLRIASIAAISGENDGVDGEDDNSGNIGGESGTSGGISSYCHNGGEGSISCSIDAGVEIKIGGVSAGCSVSCTDGYYACCSLRCTCEKR